MTADRKKRLLRIMEIVSTRAVRTQEELVDILNAEGWEVTQSSVSRDVAALRLAKVEGAYRRPTPASAVTDPDEQRIAEGVLALDPAGEVLLVLHTAPGEANRVAVAIDRLAWAEIVGTIAGDDTIFVAVQDRTAQRQVAQNIRRLQTRR
jgi:transcriptional regulator of arginine metabolism